MKRIAVVLVVAVVMLGFVVASRAAEAGGGDHYACNNDKKVTDTYDGPALEVTVRDSCFGPTIARIGPGTELRWVNRGQLPHNLVDVSAQTPMQDLQPGRTVTMTFAQAGAFVYFCAIHPGMTGAVFVGDSLADANPELINAAPSVPPPSVASVRVPARAGVSTLTVALLALAVGTIAGGGSTLFVRLLDHR